MASSKPIALPPPTALPALIDQERADVLTLLFEHSTTLTSLLESHLRSTPYPTYDALITAVAERLIHILDRPTPDLPISTLDKILSSHPRLGASDPATLSAASRSEQKQLQSQWPHKPTEAEAEAADLTYLNEAYEAHFEGLVYLVFVNGRPRAEILEDLQSRFERDDVMAERRDGIRALCDIAANRAGKYRVAASVEEWRRNRGPT